MIAQRTMAKGLSAWCLTMTLVAFLLAGLAGSSVLATDDTNTLTLRVGTYNVGHFNQGKLGGYQGTDVREALQRWQKWTRDQKFDIFLIQEWNRFFDKDGKISAADEILKPLYSSITFGQENTYIYNGVATNFKTSNFRQVPLTHKSYYITQVDWEWNGKTIVLMSVHVPWQKDSHASSITALIEELKKHEYFICAGDLNAPDADVLKIRDAGFRVANGGDEGWHCTSAKRFGTSEPNQNIDNIVTSSNITIRKVEAPHPGLNDEDHFPLTAELVIK